MHQYPLLTYDMWHFGYSKDKDSDFGEDDSSGVRMQPDHFPNVARPGGGYHKDIIVESDKPPVFCNKCDDEVVDGSCLRCDWGEKNRAVPMPNYPLDPFEDDKAGIRAGSWKFGNKSYDEAESYLEKQGYEWGGKEGEYPQGNTKSNQLIRHKDCGEETSKRLMDLIGNARANGGKGRDLLCTNPYCRHGMQNIEEYMHSQGWYFAEGYPKYKRDDGRSGPQDVTRIKQKIIHDCDNPDSSRTITINDLREAARDGSTLRCPSPVCRIKRIPEIEEYLKNQNWWWTNGRPEGDSNTSQSIRHECGQIIDSLNIDQLHTYVKRGSQLRCANPDCSSYHPGGQNYKDDKDGQVYAFNIGSTIKLGITNNIQTRIEKYRQPQKRQKKDYDYYEPAINLPEIEEWATIPTNLPKDEKPIEKYQESPNRRSPGGRDVPSVAPEWLEEQTVIEPQGGDNFYVTEPMDGRVAKNIELIIKAWWSSLGLSTHEEFANYTETITVNPQETSLGQDVANGLTLDLHIFLIEKLIQNGGHMSDLSSVMTQDDQTKLLSFFNNNTEAVAAAFGFSVDENNQIVPGNILGKELGINLQFDNNGQITSLGLPAPIEYQTVPSTQIITEENYEPTRQELEIAQRMENQPQPATDEELKKIIDYESQDSVEYDIDGNPIRPMSSWDFKTANEWDGFDDQAAGDLEGWSTQETKDVYDIFHNRSKSAERDELKDLFQFESTQTMPSENGKLSLREFTEFLLKNIVAPYNQFLIGVNANHILSEEKVDWPSLYKVIEQEAIAEEEQFHDELHHLEGHTPQEHRLCPICNKPPEPDNLDAPGDTTIPPEWNGFN